MSNVIYMERLTLIRVIRFFTVTLGYRYLGDFKDRANNSNIETEILDQGLASNDVSPILRRLAINRIQKTPALDSGIKLCDANKEVHNLLC